MDNAETRERQTGCGPGAASVRMEVRVRRRLARSPFATPHNAHLSVRGDNIFVTPAVALLRCTLLVPYGAYRFA